MVPSPPSADRRGGPGARWRRVVLAGLVALCTSAGCTGAGGTHPPAFEILAKGSGPAFAASDYPVAPGPHLTYRFEVAGQTTTTDADAWGLGKLTRDDGVVVELEALSEPGKPVSVTQVRRTANALQSWGTGTLTLEGPPVSILAFPMRPGCKWVSRDIAGNPVLESRVVGVESVTVPAGTYRAWKVSELLYLGGGHTSTSIHWYAKGIGLVKRTGGGLAFSELVKVTP